MEEVSNAVTVLLRVLTVPLKVVTALVSAFVAREAVLLLTVLLNRSTEFCDAFELIAVVLETMAVLF